MTDYFGENVVFTYTRAQAIDDGVLADVTELAKEAGFKVPVAITGNALAFVPDARLLDVLLLARLTAQAHGDLARVDFKAIGGGELPVEFACVIGPGDEGEPVVTIMLRDED